jgi:uncharacterized OB-fold protein
MAAYLPAGVPRPVPMPDGLDVPYLDSLLEHRVVVPRCPECGTWQWPPEVLCWQCRHFGLGWEEVEATGVLFSWTRIWHPVRPELQQSVPYLVGLVELSHAGGIRLIGNILGDPHTSPHSGDRLWGVFEDHPGDRPYTLLQWERQAPPR